MGSGHLHTDANSITVSAILISKVCKYENMWKLDKFETKGTVTFTVVLRMLVGEIESFCWESMRFAHKFVETIVKYKFVPLSRDSPARLEGPAESVCSVKRRRE